MAAWTKTSAEVFCRNVNKNGSSLYFEAHLQRSFNGVISVRVQDKQNFSNPTKSGGWRELLTDTDT